MFFVNHAIFFISFDSINNKLPLIVRGASDILPIKYISPISSAQVKTTILLAGLNSEGTSEIIEPYSSRNHSENLLKYYGADIKYDTKKSGKNSVLITGGVVLKSCNIIVPGDISSAAFALVAATITPGSYIKILNVGINYFRSGILEALDLMGAKISLENKITNDYQEPLADITVEYSKLKGVNISSSYSSRMIDEYPILAIAAAVASGKTKLRGLAELRHKESDRFQAIINGLESCGIKVESDNDDIIIYGNNKILGGTTIDCNHDHRVAMSFMILGALSLKPIKVIGCKSISTSYPTFVSDMNCLGMDIRSND